MAKLNTGTRIYGSANVDGMLVVGQISPNNANVGLANTGSLQVWGGAYISGNTTIGRQTTTEQVYVQGNSNLLTYSQNLENAAWFKSTSIVRFGPSANTYAPDGTNTASQLINTTGGVDTGYVDQYVTTANRNTPYTFSSYVKQGSCPFAQINMYVYDGTVNNAQANVNFSTGTVAVAGVNLVNSTFVPVGGGWYRVSITLNSLVHTQIICRLYLRPPGVAGEFGYFWGAQLEPGITPSAYANTSSGNIVKANNNLFVMGNTFIYGGNTSISNTTGSLVVSGGLGVSGNVNVSNTLSIRTESGGNIPFVMQPGVVGVFGARFGVAGEILDFYTTGSPIYFSTNGARTASQFVIPHTASAVNYLQVTGNTTGGGVVLSGQGSDTNVGININPKGAGSANVTSTANSTSNTSGALVVTGGLGITGNLFMSAANNFFLTTNGAQSYRLGWTDNYFMRSNQFGGAEFTGTFLNINSNFYTTSSYIARGLILNDTGNNTVLFASSSPVRLQNTTASTSNTTGALIVDGGVGVSGNIWVGGTNAGANGVYTDVLRYAANGLPWVMNSGTGGGGGTGTGNANTFGWLANTIIVANSAGYLSNSNISFSASNSNIQLNSAAIANLSIKGTTAKIGLFSTGTSAGFSSLDIGDGAVVGDYAYANVISNSSTGVSSLTINGGNRADLKVTTGGTSGVVGLTVESTSFSLTPVYANVQCLLGSANVQILGSQTGTFSGTARLKLSATSGANLMIECIGTAAASTNASLRIYGGATAPAYANVGQFNTTASQVNIISSLQSISNSTGALVVTGGVGVSGNIYVGGTTAGQTGVYTDNLRYAANGLPWSTNSSSANTLTTPSFSISESGGKLIFKYGSTVIASMGANGIFISANNVIAGGTP